MTVVEVLATVGMFTVVCAASILLIVLFQAVVIYFRGYPAEVLDIETKPAASDQVNGGTGLGDKV